MVGQAKNEVRELIVGTLLTLLGGFLLGYAINEPSLSYLVVSAIPIVIAGVILEVRVLRKFSFDMNKVKDRIKDVMKTIDQNMDDIQNSKHEINETKRDVSKTSKEIKKTQQNLNYTVNKLETAKDVLEKIERDIYPRNTVTNPNLLIRRFESIENFTMFDIEKQPILFLYKNIVTQNSKTDLKSTQDFKLIKLLSLIYKLVWYNNSLLYYKDTKILFEPLITLMNKKKST